jgi:hypothetical protein
VKDRPSFHIEFLVFVVCLFFDRDDAFEMDEILLYWCHPNELPPFSFTWEVIVIYNAIQNTNTSV